MNKKLDPGLRSKLRARSRSKAAPASSDHPAGVASERIGIIVEFTGSLETLTAVGFEKHSLIEHPTKG